MDGAGGATAGLAGTDRFSPSTLRGKGGQVEEGEAPGSALHTGDQMVVILVSHALFSVAVISAAL